MSKVSVNYKYDMPVTILREGEMFVAYCPVLDLSTCGKTDEEAYRNMKEAIDLFFQDCLERGTLDEALASLGWRKTSKPHGRWQPPQVVEERHFPVAIPAPA